MPPLHFLIPGFALAIQLISLYLALRLARYSENRKVGIVLVLVIFVMSFRQVISLLRYFSHDTFAIEVFAESAALFISLLILYGIILIGRFFKLAEENKRAATYTETLYRTLFNQSPDGVILLNMEGEVVEFNEEANRQLGYTRDEFKKLRIADLDPVESPEETQASFEKVLKEGKDRFAVRHITKGGEIRDVLVIAQKIELNGEILFHAIWRDITERKKAEEALRESEDKFRSIFEEAIDGMMMADAETKRQLEANKAMCSMFGYTREELVGLSMDDIHPKEALPSIRKLFEKQRRGEISLVSDVPMLRKDGTVFYADVNATRVTLGGKLCLVGIFRDITERKQEEEKLLQSRNLLRESQRIARLGSYMLDISTGWWRSTDLLDKIFGINRQYERSVEGWAALIHPDDRTMMTDYFSNEILGKGKSFDKEYRIIRYNDQAERWVHGIGQLEFDAQGQPLKLYGTIQDITDRKKLEEQLLKNQKLESIGTLAGGIAHDFNNLLQGIFGYISMAKNNIEDKEESLALLSQAEEALNLSVNLTTQLLTFSKGGKPVKKLIRLSPVVESAVKFALSGSQTNYEMMVPADLRAVEADEGQLAQVIQNMVLNAKEAMSGHGTVYLSLANVDSLENHISSLAAGGPFVRIDIQDSGLGISEQDLARIFDPYFSTKQEGSGLGLATSYSIIKNHGGTIEVKSTVDIGTTFTILLPAAAADIRNEEALPERASRVRKGRILLMDDEELVRSVAKGMIEVLGHKVDTAADGAKAIELFEHARKSDTPYDLVILDLTVKGGMGGEESIKKIRETDPLVAAVVSSGYADNPIVADFQAYGFTSSLNKPYQLEDLENCIETVLGKVSTGS